MGLNTLDMDTFLIDKKYDISLNVYLRDRKIIIFSGMYDDEENGKKVEPKLYDLIMAGYVEKSRGVIICLTKT